MGLSLGRKGVGDPPGSLLSIGNCQIYFLKSPESACRQRRLLLNGEGVIPRHEDEAGPIRHPNAQRNAGSFDDRRKAVSAARFVSHGDTFRVRELATLS